MGKMSFAVTPTKISGSYPTPKSFELQGVICQKEGRILNCRLHHTKAIYDCKLKSDKLFTCVEKTTLNTGVELTGDVFTASKIVTPNLPLWI